MPADAKVTEEFFRTRIATRLGADREDVRLGPKHGCDFGVIRGSGEETATVLATDPISILPALGFERAGRFALHIVLSDVAVSGIAPTHIAVSLSLPPEMTDEEADVATIYEEYGPGTVTVRRELTVDELAAVFATGADLLHYVGHCDTGGFECVDGRLAVADLPENRVETFFLNACGSFREGRALVESGSVAGGVTYRKVLDSEAATVGTTFARLVATGFGVERAMRLARRRVMMGKDYAVVGDGSHSLSATGAPLLVEVDSAEEGFCVRCRSVADRTAGDTYSVALADCDAIGLCGGTVPGRLDRPELRAFLAEVSMPIIFDGVLYWATDLADRL